MVMSLMVMVMSMTASVFMMTVMAALLIVMMPVMAASVSMMVMLLVQTCFLEKIRWLRRLLNSLTDYFAVQLVPWGGNDGRIRILLPDQVNRLFEFLIRHGLGTAQYDCSSMFNLVAVKLSKVSQIALYFLAICNCNTTVQFDPAIFLHISDCTSHIGEFTHAGWLDENPVRMILLHDLF